MDMKDMDGALRRKEEYQKYARQEFASPCNEKIRAILVRGTTKALKDIKSDKKYNLYQYNGNVGTHKGK